MSNRYMEIDKDEDIEESHQWDQYGYMTCLGRYIGLSIVFLGLFILPGSILSILSIKPSIPILQQQFTLNKNCSPDTILSAHFGRLPIERHDLLSIPYSSMNPQITNSPNKINIPVYMNHDMNEPSDSIKYVYIIQHGNLRNGFDYYCAASNSLSETTFNMSNVLIIAPQFLIENDTCWGSSNQPVKVDFDDKMNCDLPAWTSEGWKDGHQSKTHTNLFSYDIFDAIINILGSKQQFPNIETISFFGFSAGGQVVLRYASMPSYTIDNSKTKVRFIVSDPSTFLYLDNQRPFTNGTTGFGIPDGKWLPSNWMHSERDGSDWTPSWDSNCEAYNNWRYGLEKLNGYAERKASKDQNFKQNLIRDFQYRDISYLLGKEDDSNCKLESSPSCDDHELATYCQAMLQGINRVDRMLKWLAYLEYFYGHAVHQIIEADGISHDAVAMLHSEEGKCVVFGMCPSSSSSSSKYTNFPIKIVN